MATAAGEVHVHQRLVRGQDLRGAMAGGAVPVCGVVVFMAAGTADSLRCRSEADRRLMALHAGDVLVGLMGKVYLPPPRLMTEHRHLNIHGFGTGELGILMADGAITRGGILVMADLAPAGWLEREGPPFGPEIVAGEAGKSFMAFMGEGVAGGDGHFDPILGRVVLRGGCPLPPAASRRDQAAGRLARRALLESPGRVERQRWAEAAPRAIPHRPVTAHAVARVDPGAVRHVAGLAALGGLAMRSTGVEVHLPPGDVAPRVGARLERVAGLRIRMRVVAHSAAAAVWL